jgi:hypothetical protein
VACFLAVDASRGRDVVGYWQDWVNVDWWSAFIPGSCLMGCAQPAVFLEKAAPYSQVNFGFAFLSENPLPHQNTCDNSTTKCPIWDGTAIYAARASAQGSIIVSDSIDVHSINNSPGLVAISEVCRLARQGPTGPKRCLISFGGWSDWARLGNVENAKKAAKLAAKMVLLSFADGIDLDFEHLSEYTQLDGGETEFDAYNTLVETLRQEFNAITPEVWSNTADARYADLEAYYNTLPDPQKAQYQYYPTNMKYMQELKQNGPPYFEICWTTRFNAFINKTSPHNYLDSSSPVPPPFLTDNEGTLIWPQSGNNFDSVNIMAYDGGSPAGPLKFNFHAILNNFKAYGPPPGKINMGFEPGNQFGGGVWEGIDIDTEVAKFIRNQDFGGAMIWPINPDPAVEPEAAHWCPILAQSLNKIIAPQWPFGKAPTYSKCNPSTGWL